MIALAMPGKHGDAIFSWSLCRHLWKTTGEFVVWHTSEYCRPLENLCRAQAWCGGFCVPEDYRIVDMGCGCQPWYMTIPNAESYSRILQCGFQRTPDCALGDWMARQHGLPDGLPIEYETPEEMAMTPPYVVLAARGETTFRSLFAAFVEACPIQVVEIGGRGDRCSEKSMDCTGADYLLTAGIIKRAKAFVGLMSSQLVLANGFPIPRIAPTNGGWDLRHVHRSPLNYYPFNPTAGEMLKLCGL